MKKLLLILLLSALAALAGCAADPDTGRHDSISESSIAGTEHAESAESRNDLTGDRGNQIIYKYLQSVD